MYIRAHAAVYTTYIYIYPPTFALYTRRAGSANREDINTRVYRVVVDGRKKASARAFVAHGPAVYARRGCRCLYTRYLCNKGWLRRI